MTKLLLSILLVLVSGAYCRNDSSSSVGPSPTTSAPTTSAPLPSPTKLPTSAPDFLYRYINSSTNMTCIKMNASLGLTVEYKDTSGQQVNVTLAVNKPANITDESFCNVSIGGGVSRSLLQLQWQYTSGNVTYNLSFHLEANWNKGQEQWNVTSVNATIPINNSSDLPSQPENGVDHLSAGYSDLVESLDFTRSYFCNATRHLNMTVNGPGHNSYNVTLNIANFQIQAFQFANTTTYEYGNAVRCSQDIKGSKLVPIIVGAALAGLVIVVLIAYIIGRYRSRKHNSYEALS